MTQSIRPRIAVLIPCHNEAPTIAKVVSDFMGVLPTSKIYVYDNNSTDATLAIARESRAIVRQERLQGKGNVIRRMFADIEADIYVMVDGDDTYDSSVVMGMIDLMIENDFDLVNGKRESSNVNAYRAGHKFGNWMLSSLVSSIFGDRVEDMLSGLKIFSRRFVKSFPALTSGFEIETELTIHALELRMAVGESPVRYGERKEGSTSKLNTFRDGIKIAVLIVNLLRAERPMLFFGIISVVLGTSAILLAIPLIVEFGSTGLVPKFPTAILATGLMIVAALSLVCGLILQTVTLGRREAKRMIYLTCGSLHSDLGR